MRKSKSACRVCREIFEQTTKRPCVYCRDCAPVVAAWRIASAQLKKVIRPRQLVSLADLIKSDVCDVVDSIDPGVWVD